MASSSLSSLTSRTTQSKYDVFISFRGEDTGKNFADHLFAALTQRGIIAFRDENSLERGRSIAPELLKAIEESRFSIVLLSPNYASSNWCLDELIKILECKNNMGQQVFPVFYKVDPSDVRKQTGNFGEAFDKLEEKIGKDDDRVEQWRIALKDVANLSGWDLQNSHETKLIRDIVEEIFIRLNNTFSSSTRKDLVGIVTHLEKLNLLLDLSSDDVRIIGIHGMGGIGKTTIARVVFEMISHQFEASSFLANVREVSGNGEGLVLLQEQLLNETLQGITIKIWDTYKGINIIRKRLCCKKVLVVLDDVDKSIQLEALLADRNWLGSGSRIIITTRDSHLLVRHQVDKVYKMEALNFSDASHLFNLKAFKSVHPKAAYLELSEKFVSYAGGLPLALEVLGGMLYGRSVDEWMSALERLKTDPEKEIFDKLEISFDMLKLTEKKIFLDIACFFKGMDQNLVTNVLDSCQFNATIGINVLLEKSLIWIGNENIVHMHDLLQEMGQNIVKRESLNELGKCSRLWDDNDIFHMFTETTETKAIEVITCKSFEQKEVNLNAKAFVNMKKLRLLKISNVQLHQGLDFLPNELRLLEWHAYPLKHFPLSFKPDKIVALNMSWSSITQLWDETISFDRLRFINLSHCINLQATPNFTGTPNLEELILEGCISLVEVHPSVGLLQGLKLLNLKGCTRLRIQPPSSIVLLKNFKKSSFGGWISQPLSSLLSHFSFPRKGPNSLCLSLPPLSGLSSLTELNISNLNLQEGAIPFNIGSLSSLKYLDLSSNEFVTIPLSISQLTNLEQLCLTSCKKLRRLPLLPASISLVRAEDCIELEDFPNPLEHCTSIHSIFNFFNCYRMVEYQDCSILAMTWLKYYLQGPPRQSTKFEIILPGSQIPQWIGLQKIGNLVSLDLTPNWFNDTFKGFAVCAVLRPEPREVSRVIIGLCSFSFSDIHPFCLLVKTSTQFESDHIWFFYMPVAWYSDTNTNFHVQNQITFAFYTDLCSVSNVEVKKCAARLVYAQDIEDLLSCDEPTKEKLLVKRNRKDCIESQHNQTWSLDDELH